MSAHPATLRRSERNDAHDLNEPMIRFGRTVNYMIEADENNPAKENGHKGMYQMLSQNNVFLQAPFTKVNSEDILYGKF